MQVGWSSRYHTPANRGDDGICNVGQLPKRSENGVADFDSVSLEASGRNGSWERVWQ